MLFVAIYDYFNVFNRVFNENNTLGDQEMLGSPYHYLYYPQVR